MNAVTFPEWNKDIIRPSDMTDEECSSLPVYNDDIECISKWSMTFRERLHCLFRGYIWLRVRSGKTQPPVALCACETVFERNE